MKYLAALPLAASLVAAQMSAMSVVPAPAGGAATHTIAVGGTKAEATGGPPVPVLGYNPESITANVGDMVVFVFGAKNHTVTQSTFDAPCNKMDGGMDSGFQPNPDGSKTVMWNMTVNAMGPLWFYCKQKEGTHCGKGMVFAINAPTSGAKTFEVYKQLAISKNGTQAATLTSAGIQDVTAAPAAPSTVTVVAGNGGSQAAGSAVASATGAAATLAQGQGTDSTGNACTCQCLCGINQFPAQAAVGNFGGFPGQISPM